VIEILAGWCPWAAAFLWFVIIAPEIALMFKVPIQKRSSPLGSRYERLTKPQFVWTFGVLELGITFFIVNFGDDLLKSLLTGNRHFGVLSHLLFDLGFSIAAGIVVGLWSAPTQLDRSPLTEIKLSQKQ
jgi:hypothetical protein